jgi:hypothetical protein
VLFRWADNTKPDSLASRLRQKRISLLFDLLDDLNPPIRILDVGGTIGFWKLAPPEKLAGIHLTLLNLSQSSTDGMPNAESISGDARDLSRFQDKSFDLCFSNSVIEHVGTLFDQIAMAREIDRVAKRFFVQTPNRYFPLEPHFHVPLWQFLPLACRSAMHRRFKLGWMEAQPDPLRARASVEQVRLLSRTDMQRLFPDARIVEERFAFMTKSLFAIKRQTSGLTSN